MAVETPRRRRRRNASSESGGDIWGYFVTIKWIVIGLVISLGCVFTFDLVSTIIISSLFKGGRDNGEVSKCSNEDNCGGDKSVTKQSFPWGSNDNNAELSSELRDWMVGNDLEQFSSYFKEIGNSNTQTVL